MYPTAGMIAAATDMIEKTADRYTIWRYDPAAEDLVEHLADVPITVQPYSSSLRLAAGGYEAMDDYLCFVPAGYDIVKGDVVKIGGIHYLVTSLNAYGTHVELTLKINGEADA